MKYQLSEFERSALHIIAALWSISADFHDLRSAASYSDSNRRHFLGVVGEYSFSKLHNLFFDFAPNGQRPNRGADVVTRAGARVDIKTVTIKSGSLILSSRKNTDVDIFVLCYYDEDKNAAEFIGYIDAAEAYKTKPIKFKNKPVYWIDRDNLKPFSK